MNDNHRPRTPAEHRAYVAQQSANQTKGNTKPYKAGEWPQGERLYASGNTAHISTLNRWQRLNAAPVLCVANDNFIDDAGEVATLETNHYDNRMDTETADNIVARYNAGKSWRPGEERFERPRRNKPERSMPAGTYKANGVSLYQQEADAQDEIDRAIDCKRTRAKLGPVVSMLLDEAASDSTTEHIAAVIKCDVGRAEFYIDAAIAKYAAIAA